MGSFGNPFFYMAKHWQNPPHDKKEIRRREEKFPHLRKAKDYKENNQHANRLNKSYRTLFDIDNKYQYYSVVSKYMDTFNIYKSIDYLVKNKYFDIDYIGKRKIIPSEQVEEELFRREMCTFRDWLIWDNDKSRENAKKNKSAQKRRTRKFYMILPDGRKFWFGSYDTKRVKLAKDVSNFLYKHCYIFDKQSPYYLSDAQIRKVVREKMMTRSFEKLNLQSYISEIKDKMLKKDK